MYQVFARKWRPKIFSEVVGQEYILTALSNSLGMRKLHHAYLFSGKRGVGKTTIARLLAKGLNCVNGITAKICNQCDNCCEIESGRFVDLIEIDGASRTKVEDTRELLDNIQYLPVKGRFKIYLIDEVHMLSRYSFNALLKTLEEPPNHVKFILATTDPQKIPLTVISRCLRFHLRNLNPRQIFDKLVYILKQECIPADFKALQLLSSAAHGSMRDALSLTEQVIAVGHGEINTNNVNLLLGILDNEQPLNLVQALVSGNGPATIKIVHQMASQGVEWDSILVEILSLLHQTAMIQCIPDIFNNNQNIKYFEHIKKIATEVPSENIQFYYQTFLRGRKNLSLAPTPRIGIEMTLLNALTYKVKGLDDQDKNNLLLEPQKKLVKLSSKNKLISSQINQDVNHETNLVINVHKKITEDNIITQKFKNTAPNNDQESCNSSEVSELLQSYKLLKDHKILTSVENKIISQKYVNKSVILNKVNNLSKLSLEQNKLIIQKNIKSAEFINKLFQELKKRDEWTAEIDQLQISKLTKLLALNSWKEITAHGICLHLRSTKKHLNSIFSRTELAEALSAKLGSQIKLSVVEDDNIEVLTPIELGKLVSKEHLGIINQLIKQDSQLQMVCDFFGFDAPEQNVTIC